MTEKYFCPSSCGFFHEGEVKGACNVCSHKADIVYEKSKWGILLDYKVVEVVGESKTEYYLEGGGSILKESVELE